MSRDPIQDYVEALSTRLHGPAAHVRRILAETEAHLLDAAEAEQAAGADPVAAQHLAVSRFGSPELVAGAANRATWSRFRRPLLGQGAVVVAGVAAAGLVAMGVTAVMARVVAGVTSTATVYGFPERTAPAAASCAHWLAVNPATTTCRQAAAIEESADLTMGLAVAGVLGLLLALAVVALAVFARGRRTAVRLPPMMGPAASLVAFGLAATGCAVLAASDAVVLNTWGSGLYWTAAATCAAAALASAGLVIRTLPVSVVGRPSGRGEVTTGPR